MEKLLNMEMDQLEAGLVREKGRQQAETNELQAENQQLSLELKRKTDSNEKLKQTIDDLTRKNATLTRENAALLQNLDNSISNPEQQYNPEQVVALQSVAEAVKEPVQEPVQVQIPQPPANPPAADLQKEEQAAEAVKEPVQEPVKEPVQVQIPQPPANPQAADLQKEQQAAEAAKAVVPVVALVSPTPAAPIAKPLPAALTPSNGSPSMCKMVTYAKQRLADAGGIEFAQAGIGENEAAKMMAICREVAEALRPHEREETRSQKQRGVANDLCRIFKIKELSWSEESIRWRLFWECMAATYAATGTTDRWSKKLTPFANGLFVALLAARIKDGDTYTVAQFMEHVSQANPANPANPAEAANPANPAEAGKPRRGLRKIAKRDTVQSDEIEQSGEKGQGAGGRQADGAGLDATPDIIDWFRRYNFKLTQKELDCFITFVEREGLNRNECWLVYEKLTKDKLTKDVAHPSTLAQCRRDDESSGAKRRRDDESSGAKRRRDDESSGAKRRRDDESSADSRVSGEQAP